MDYMEQHPDDDGVPRRNFSSVTELSDKVKDVLDDPASLVETGTVGVGV